MKKYICLLLAVLAVSMSACSNGDTSSVTESKAETNQADSQAEVSQTSDGSETTDLSDDEESAGYIVRLGIEDSDKYSIDDEATMEKIDDWIQRAFDDPGTELIEESIDRSGAIFEIKTGDKTYNIDVFEDDSERERTEEDGDGTIQHQYNVSADGECYWIPVELTNEITDIISEAIDVDIHARYGIE